MLCPQHRVVSGEIHYEEWGSTRLFPGPDHHYSQRGPGLLLLLRCLRAQPQHLCRLLEMQQRRHRYWQNVVHPTCTTNLQLGLNFILGSYIGVAHIKTVLWCLLKAWLQSCSAVVSGGRACGWWSILWTASSLGSRSCLWRADRKGSSEPSWPLLVLKVGRGTVWFVSSSDVL